jgi:hypothetical protein
LVFIADFLSALRRTSWRQYKSLIFAFFYIGLITLIDYMIFPARYFLAELWQITLYVVLYLTINYVVLYIIICPPFAKKTAKAIVSLYLALLLLLAMPNLSSYFCNPVNPPLEASRVILAFKGLLIDKQQIVSVSKQPARYITHNHRDFMQIMAQRGFGKVEELGDLWIFTDEINNRTIKVDAERYAHAYELWNFGKVSMENLQEH